MTNKDNKICIEYQEKNGRNWVTVDENDDERVVFRSLARDLVKKKIHGAAEIFSIKRVPLYNGYDKIIVNVAADYRRVYTIEQ